METKRKDVRVPVVLIEQIDEYKNKEGITTWTGALLELARKGLECYNKEKSGK